MIVQVGLYGYQMRESFPTLGEETRRKSRRIGNTQDVSVIRNGSAAVLVEHGGQKGLAAVGNDAALEFIGKMDEVRRPNFHRIEGMKTKRSGMGDVSVRD
jgi:hypothetical protein